MSLTLSIYNSLPFWGKNLAASLRGYYLRSWRYDGETESLVAEILERDRWPLSRWDQWQQQRLEYVLERAAQQVPYYREARKNKADASALDLASWDVLEKPVLRRRARDFVAVDVDRAKMFCDHTSGTTASPLDIWQSPETVKLWYAMSEARWKRWYGVSRHDRWAILGGQMVTPVSRRKPPYWVWNAGLNQLYLSSYHLAPDLIGSYIDALVRYEVVYVLGYSSAIYSLARGALKLGRDDFRPKVAITNAEPLYEHQREVIARAFGCPVRETYGMAEMAAAASECEDGSLHIWPDAGIIEIDGVPGATGDLICTGLVNADMPLVRYRVGDRGRLADGGCTCGRSLPVLDSVEGRTDDILFTSDGREVGRLDPVFKSDIPVSEAQIVQTSLDEVTLRVVPEAGFGPQTEADLSGRLRDRMGDVRISFELVPEIPRTSRGKFRAVVCELPEDQKRELTGGVTN